MAQARSRRGTWSSSGRDFRVRSINGNRLTANEVRYRVSRRPTSSWPETGFGAISLRLNDHTERGVGGRQYGTSKDIEMIQA